MAGDSAAGVLASGTQESVDVAYISTSELY